MIDPTKPYRVVHASGDVVASFNTFTSAEYDAEARNRQVENDVRLKRKVDAFDLVQQVLKNYQTKSRI